MYFPHMFSRLPNILGLALMLVIWFSGYLNLKTVGQVFIQSLIFAFGFGVMSFLLFSHDEIHAS